MKVYKQDDMVVVLKNDSQENYGKLKADKVIYNPKSQMMFAYSLDKNRYVLFGVFPTVDYEVENYRFKDQIWLCINL